MIDKTKITKGEFEVHPFKKDGILGFQVWAHTGETIPLILASLYHKTNAKFISQAFNVFNKTNLTPEELNEEREEKNSKLAKWVTDLLEEKDTKIKELTDQNKELLDALKEKIGIYKSRAERLKMSSSRTSISLENELYNVIIDLEHIIQKQ